MSPASPALQADSLLLSHQESLIYLYEHAYLKLLKMQILQTG